MFIFALFVKIKRTVFDFDNKYGAMHICVCGVERLLDLAQGLRTALASPVQ